MSHNMRPTASSLRGLLTFVFFPLAMLMRDVFSFEVYTRWEMFRFANETDVSERMSSVNAWKLYTEKSFSALLCQCQFLNVFCHLLIGLRGLQSVLGVARSLSRGRSIFIMSTLSSNPAMGSFDCFGFGNNGTVIPPVGDKRATENSTIEKCQLNNKNSDTSSYLQIVLKLIWNQNTFNARKWSRAIKTAFVGVGDTLHINSTLPNPNVMEQYYTVIYLTCCCETICEVDTYTN